MPRVPPIVRYRVTGGAAYLVAWQQLPDRSWWARILWVELEGDTYRGAEARVDARDVEQVPGQDYSQVPRRRVDPRRPRDLTDPRDPGRTSRAADRARVDNRRGPSAEPDF
jgi:hypothetical protein